MRNLCAGGVAAAALVGLAACSVPQAQPPQNTATLSVPGYVPAQSSAQVLVTTPPPPPVYEGMASPPAPPPAQVEVIPPSPGGTAAWQPGHWRWTGIAGSQWQWVPGQYVASPVTTSQWVPGHWAQQGGGWVWVDGHWS